MRENEIQLAPARDAADQARAEAFRRVAEGHLLDAYKLAGAILGDPTESRDAVHDAFIAAWQQWPSLRDQSKFQAWFKRIVVNECRDRLRRSSRRRAEDVDEQVGLRAPDTSGQMHDRLLIEAAIRDLKTDDRIVLALRYYRDLRVDDIATLLDIPTGTVKSRLNHAHARLRAVIERSQPRRDPR